MNVYDMKQDRRDEVDWICFYTKNKLAMPPTFDECVPFFEAHPRIAIDRNTDFTPRGSKAKFSDYSNVNHNVHPVFSQRAKRILEPHLQGLGRWIELESDEAPYWLFFVTHIVDALDMEKSELLYFGDGKRVMRIARYAFKADLIKDQFLFTLPQAPGKERLVTDRFIDLVAEHQLTGFWFQRLWSQTRGPEPAVMENRLRPRYTGLEPRSMRESGEAPQWWKKPAKL
jgi:hypothetical protein